MYSAAIGSTHKAAALAALLRSLRARGDSNGTNGSALLLRRLLLNRCQKAFEQALPPGAPMTPARRCCLCAPPCHRRPAARIPSSACACLSPTTAHLLPFPALQA